MGCGALGERSAGERSVGDSRGESFGDVHGEGLAEAVGEAEGRKWAADRKMGYFETSAKDGDGVGELFLSLFTEAMAR